ncbi:adenosylhomocysteinase [Luteipulveratus mongoliensis]|uniref:S-adenosyl-L-homocysteine hydrolase n=1 Tax=Luteipulveratus mongoliensis TaxID=571913 RepID=A0A0K1JNR8_9MICO|nr:adenosylhomocysteinase [Luteipulveratus mongoliensis]AKU18228.1 S-adenosyl-L-homocysteine hydrolase [Luteipulveratus mongoliensis]
MNDPLLHPALPAPGIDWTADHMPLIHAAFDEIGDVFAGLRIAMCLHIEPKTAVLCRLLVEHGATVALTGSPGTTRPETAEALAADGVLVHADAADKAPRIDDVLAIDPHLLLDNGADLTLGLLGRPRSPHFLGGTEETTTGAMLLRAHEQQPDFPVVVINDSELKLMVENRFGVGQSVVQGFMNATNLMVPGTLATVVGYGPCGRGVAQTLRQLGALVTVVDTDPYRTLEALMEGFAVAPLADALPQTRLLFLATGAPGVVGPDEVTLLRDGVIVAGVSHHAWELDLALLGPVIGAASYYRVHQQEDGRRISVLAENRMLNLVAAIGNPIEAMDLGFTLQARSLAAVAAGGLEPGVQPVPSELDRSIARAFVTARTGVVA